MNPILYAIDQVMLKIPRDILDYAFIRQFNYSNAIAVSVASRIREDVIERRIRTDCNLIGGQCEDIPLGTIPPHLIDPFNTVYRVPKSLTQGRTITRALSVSFGEGSVMGTAHMTQRNSNPMLEATQGILNSHLPIPAVATGYVSVIGENLILIRENYTLPRNVYLKCWLEHDENMTHIQPSTYKAFAKLVVYAVQSYIYNTLIIKMDQGQIYAGSELGAFRNVVEGYSDAEENYEDYFRVAWRKISLMNDHEWKRRNAKMLTGGLH